MSVVAQTVARDSVTFDWTADWTVTNLFHTLVSCTPGRSHCDGFGGDCITIVVQVRRFEWSMCLVSWLLLMTFLITLPLFSSTIQLFILPAQFDLINPSFFLHLEWTADADLNEDETGVQCSCDIQCHVGCWDFMTGHSGKSNQNWHWNPFFTSFSVLSHFLRSPYQPYAILITEVPLDRSSCVSRVSLLPPVHQLSVPTQDFLTHSLRCFVSWNLQNISRWGSRRS